ncbi:hypothetical protein PUN28_011826 [Cardiocondyla obscurior]|uniref:Reverse transcriptase zinc-binding domain-containing protein n=1 Tax=Cardiocondyla obscurior TaxID=286306 RepID=A0AAW2FLB6_9HYME
MEARKAAEEGEFSKDLLPFSDLTALWKNKMYKDSLNFIQEKCINHPHTANYYNIFLEKSRKPWFRGIKLPRRAIVSINRIRAGRTSLASDLHLIKILESPLCKCGMSEQTVNHMFWQCGLYKEKRASLTKFLYKGKNHGPFWIEEFLSSLDPEVLTEIANFILKIDIRI